MFLNTVNNFGSRELKRSALNLGNAEQIFKELLHDKGFSTILEIGTYKGATAACMSQYCDRVVTIDLVQGRLEQTDPLFSRTDFWKRLEIDNIDLVLVESDEQKKQIVEQLDFDFVFIDGGHLFDQVKFDYEVTKHCKNILFHDYTYNKKSGDNGVRDFVNTLDRSKITVYDNIFAYYRA